MSKHGLTRRHLTRIQKALYKRAEERGRPLSGSLGSELNRYRLEYERETARFQQVTTKRELLSTLHRSHIALCGDYHSLWQAQRMVLRLLRDTLPLLRALERPAVLVLEMLDVSHDKTVARYLAGEIAEANFLKIIGFEKNWGFHWPNYRPLFDLAAKEKLSIVGLEKGDRTKKTLKARDQQMAERLAALSEKNPGALIFTLVGDLHLAASHLPNQLEHELKTRGLERRVLSVHQNIDWLYWRLQSQGLDQFIEVVRLHPKAYCVLNTPPWVKLQADRQWAEVIADKEVLSALISTRIETNSQKYFEALAELDPSDEIRDFIRTIVMFLGEPEPKADNFSVKGPSELGFLESLKAKGVFDTKELGSISRSLQSFKSHFVPRENILYLATFSVNHNAAQAAHYVHSLFSGFDRVFQDTQQDFFRFVWAEALSFFGSRIINHKRKCKTPTELALLAKTPAASKEDRALAKKALSYLKAEASALKLGTSPTLPVGTTVLQSYKISKLVGRLLGHTLYRATVEDAVSRDEVVQLFRLPLHTLSHSASERLYFEWVKRLTRLGFRMPA